MIIRVINIQDFVEPECNIMSYQSIVRETVTKNRLQSLQRYNIYDLVPVNYPFNLYVIDETTNCLNLFRKNNDLRFLSQLDDIIFNALVVSFVLGRFLGQDEDEVTRLYQDRPRVCGLELNGQIGPQVFAQAESMVPTAVVGGRKIRMRRKGNRSARVTIVKRCTRKPRRSKQSLKLKNQYKK